MMKVVQVTYGADNSSVCVKLNEELNRQGIDSEVVSINSKIESGINVVKENLVSRIIRHIRYLYENMVINLKYDKKPNAIFDISDYGLSHHRLKQVLQEYDIINMHYINGMISYKDIKWLSNSGKVVLWTMHDCWAFTGGCHHGCDKYQKECGSCKIINSTQDNDISRKIIRNKKNAYGQGPMIIVSPSNWMDNKVSKSSIFKENEHICILNGIDLDIFKPYPRKLCDKYMLLSGAVSPVTSPFKGYSKLVDIMKKVTVKYPGLLENMKLVFFGGCELSQIRNDFDNRIKIETLGYIRDREELAKIYSMSDVFLSTSVTDNLPTTIIEAAACGTPTVAFNVGGISDIIEDGRTGKLIENFDVEAYADSLVWLMNADNEHIREACRRRMEEYFDISDMAFKYKQLYQEHFKV